MLKHIFNHIQYQDISLLIQYMCIYTIESLLHVVKISSMLLHVKFYVHGQMCFEVWEEMYIFLAQLLAASSVNKNKSHTIQPQYLVVCPKTVKSSLEPKTIHPTIISTLSRFSLEVDHFRKYFRWWDNHLEIVNGTSRGESPEVPSTLHFRSGIERVAFKRIPH